jgi:hypothetical protein
MRPERWMCAVREAPQKMYIARQRLAKHASAATDTKLIPGDRLGTERVFVPTNLQQRCSRLPLDYISSRADENGLTPVWRRG